MSAPGQSMLNVTFNLNRDIDTAAQDVRDRVASAIRRLPEDIEAPMIVKQDSDNSPSLSIALSGNLSIRELTEIADKIVKVPLERSPGVGEVQIVGGLERAMSIWVEADRLAAYQLSIADVRNALQQQNADLPGGNVTTDVNERTLRTIGPLCRRRPVQRSRDRHAQRLADPRARHRPRRRRHQGSALVRAAQRHSHGGARRAPPVRRQHGRGDRSGQGQHRSHPAAPARRRLGGDRARPVDAHLRVAARDQRPPDPRQHPRLPGGVRVHARLARHRDRGSRHSDLRHLDLRTDGRARLHAEHA